MERRTERIMGRTDKGMMDGQNEGTTDKWKDKR